MEAPATYSPTPDRIRDADEIPLTCVGPCERPQLDALREENERLREGIGDAAAELREWSARARYDRPSFVKADAYDAAADLISDLLT